MRLKIKEGTIYLLLYMLCVIIPFFNNYELTFAVWVLTVLLTLKRRYSANFLIYLSLFIFIFLLAILVGLFNNYKIYYIIRDITYLLKPILGLLIGYQLFKPEFKNPLLFIVYSGVAIASYHLLLVVNAALFERVRTMHDLRYFAGYFNDFEVYVLVILIFHKSFQLNITDRNRKLFLTIIALSSFSYLARTNFIQFLPK